MNGTISPNLYRFHIGIDPGKNTGFAIWDRHEKQFIAICTCLIHEAMERIKILIKDHPGQVYVRFEDARLRTWLQDKSNAELQGAGSIKRDCTIWQDFLERYDIPYASYAPQRGMTKWNSGFFKQTTGWLQSTDEHGRDAAVLVLGK